MHACLRARLPVFVLFTSVAGAACGSVRTANGTDAAPVTLLPGSRLLASGALLTDTIEYRVVPNTPTGGAAGVDVGAGRQEWQRTTRDGRPALLLVRRFTGTGPAFVDTSVVAADGLEPLWESQRLGSRHIEFTYNGATVTRTVLSPDSAAAKREHRYDSPVFHFNEVDLLARAVPLRQGFTAIVPLYSEGDDALEHDTLSVISRDRVGTWNVRFADAVITSIYGIDPASRRIVRYEVTSRKQGVRTRLVMTAR